MKLKPHILIIEDEPDIAESIRYNIERNGEFTAQVAHDGQAALRAALGKTISSQPLPPVSLIILDVNLPDMNGFELCRRLRTEERTRQTPIIMLPTNGGGGGLGKLPSVARSAMIPAAAVAPTATPGSAGFKP